MTTGVGADCSVPGATTHLPGLVVTALSPGQAGTCLGSHDTHALPQGCHLHGLKFPWSDGDGNNDPVLFLSQKSHMTRL